MLMMGGGRRIVAGLVAGVLAWLLRAGWGGGLMPSCCLLAGRSLVLVRELGSLVCLGP